MKPAPATLIQVMTNTTTNHTEQLVSLSAAAAKLDVSLRSLYRLMSQRELAPPVKVGRSSKLLLSDIDSYIHRLKSQRPS